MVRKTNFSGWLRFLLLSLFISLLLESTGFSAANPAEIVSVRPGASLVIDSIRNDAEVGNEVNTGNILETDRFGRLSLLLPDHALLKIGSGTRFRYEGVDEGSRKWFLDKGKVWLRGLFQKRAFDVQTPTAVVGVRGTEWYMTVEENGSTTVGVVDGTVAVENPHGSLLLKSRELAMVHPGRPPVKSAYLTPDNAVNWTLRYRGLWAQSDIERASAEFRPDIQAALQAYHLNDLSEAYRLLDRNRESFGTTAPWRALAGFLEFVSGNDAEARELFRSAARSDPSWALPVAHLSLMELVENKLVRAREMSEEALRIQPESTVALITEAFVLKGSLKPEQAYGIALRAVELSPKFDQVLLTAARFALEMEDLKACRKLLTGVSDDASAAAERATLFGYLALREGNATQAEQYFKEAVSLSPEEPDAWMGLGISLFRLNRIDAGLDAMAKAALMAPQVSSFQSYLAKAFFEADMIDEARASLTRAKRLDPKDPTPYLYESLWYNEIHRPGEALQNLEKARSLNNNRSVFRSRYLLDQDQAILMGNVSQIYNRLGFDHTSIQEAAASVRVNPANQGAHRRLYFALINEPLSYQQAAVSELVLAKLFTPPTRTGVVFDEDSITPYQEMFERSGVDAVLFGGSGYSANEDTEVKDLIGSASMAAKLNAPFAFYGQITPIRNEIETKVDTIASSAAVTNRTYQQSNQELSTFFYNGFAKWQITPSAGAFIDGRFRDNHTDLSGFNQSTLSSGSIPINQIETTNTGWTDLKVGEVDFGLNIKEFSGPRGLFHVSYYDDLQKSDTLQEIVSPFYTSDQVLKSDQDVTRWIVQGALWQDWENSLFQLGFRYYTKESALLSVAEGSTFSTEYSQPEEFDFTSGYLYQRYLFSEAANWEWGFSVDRTEYVSPAENESSRTTFNPFAGITWDIDSNWRFRTAYIQNIVGDRDARLQPSVIAGFPLLRASQLDVFTGEQLLHLRRKTFAMGLDYRLANSPIFVGVEGAYDRAGTRSFQSYTSDQMSRIEMEVYSFLFYLEALLTPDLSSSVSYRFLDYDYAAPEYENRIDWKTAFFTRFGLIFNLHGIYRNKRPSSDAAGLSSTEIWSIAPSIDWYLFQNDLRLTLEGKLEEQIVGSDVDVYDTLAAIRIGVTLYF
jgi:tetratricopeptide (TPR) repeat protein